MAWRIAAYLIEGELDNTHPGRVTGWMEFAGLKDKVTFDLKGDFHRDIRGAKIHLTGDAREPNSPPDANGYMEGFAPTQTGKVGDITAGLPPIDYVNYPYIEWYSEENGRVVVELEPSQVKVVGMPIPACESDPISRDEQEHNMAEFVSDFAAQLNVAKGNVVGAGAGTVTQPAERTARTRVPGHQLLTQEIRKELPPLYAQESKSGKAVAYLKLFTPDSSWTWYITEGSPITDDSGSEVDFHFFGLVDGHEKELGYAALSELESVRGPMGLPIERDLHWRPKTLEEIAPELFRSRQTEDSV